MTRLTARTSTIFIATGDDTRVYRSVEEIPPSLRRKLRQTARGMNSATILIADRRGREELLRARDGLPSGIPSRVVELLRARQPSGPVLPEEAPASPWWKSLRAWLEVLLPAAASASLWLLLQAHF